MAQYFILFLNNIHLAFWIELHELVKVPATANNLVPKKLIQFLEPSHFDQEFPFKVPFDD